MKMRLWTCKIIYNKIGYHYQQIKYYCNKNENHYQ